MKANIYVAIIGDIINSKKISDRNDFQKKFKECLDYINVKYEGTIASKFMITLGDEFQGLLYESDSLFLIIEEIEKSIFPVKLRFGIGVGKIDTDINKEMPLGADGPAYHNARNMINQVKEKNSKYKNTPVNLLIYTGNARVDKLIESILELIYAIKSKWSNRQIEVIEAYKENNFNQYKTAEKLGIDQSTVNKALKAANVYQYHNAIKNISEYLQGKDCN